MGMNKGDSKVMNPVQTCQAIVKERGDGVIVATMLAMFVFDQLGVKDGRVSSVPLMGGAAGIGLGLALGRPDRNVIVVDGDASVLMQLGGLVNVAEQAPANFVHFVLNNGTQFTGATNLRRPGAAALDLCGMARAAGYASSERIDDIAVLNQRLPALMKGLGPSFVELIVAPAPAAYAAQGQPQQLPDIQFTRMGDEARALRYWLQASPATQISESASPANLP